MKEKRACKIIQDLLPNYIEDLTNEETNSFIEEHLKECDECKRILENMQKNLKIDENKKDNREVKYIKKYNKKLRILKIIILIIVALFLIRTLRNAIILSSLSNKAKEYVNSNNYHKITTSYNGDNLMNIETFYKDGKSVTIVKKITEDSTNKIISYENNGTQNVYYEAENIKKVKPNSNASVVSNIANWLEPANPLEFIISSVTSNIRSVECNGKECYFIDGYMTSSYLMGINTGKYFDKVTGLLIRNSEIQSTNLSGYTTDNIVDYVYEFNTVNEDVFIEPDLSEYEVIDNL